MIDINRVYETVLDAHNKENRGFITPSAFNNYATDAQLEIFESYFNGKYRASLNPMSDGDYDDTTRNLEEKIAVLDNTAAILKTNFVSDLGGVTTDYYPYPTNFYRLGVVQTDTNIIADEVSRKDASYINRSTLMAPTIKQPVYTRHEGGIIAYPETLTTLMMTYTRVPSLPSWAGGTVDGQISPLISALQSPTPGNINYYQDFSIHPSEEPLLVAKILGYAGLETRSQEVIQVSAAKDQQIIQQTL